MDAIRCYAVTRTDEIPWGSPAELDFKQEFRGQVIPCMREVISDGRKDNHVYPDEPFASRLIELRKQNNRTPNAMLHIDHVYLVENVFEAAELIAKGIC